ncbi:hypothetical protein [Spiroplasma endosymbiont of Stenodema calcarata]|uniref:hypothetical protein n=1 Tax=Spiroplasma endosymbiont of Stenodema calcarata TaxID=3139328 RepID=UPI003CCB2514
MSLQHSWTNNGLENKPENNQQQGFSNQGNNFNVSPQQYQQQGGQNPMSQQQGIMQQPPQSIIPQQYAQAQQAGVPQQYQQNVGPQQYQQQGPSAPQQYLQQQGGQNPMPQQYPAVNRPQQYQNQGASAPQQYVQSQQQQMMNQQRSNFQPQNSQGINQTPGYLQQPSVATTQAQSLADRIANLQSGSLSQNENYNNSKNIRAADLLNASIDPNIKVGLGKNMNIAAGLQSDLFENNSQRNYKKNHKLKAGNQIDELQCRCKNCIKKSRPWLTVLISVLIMLAILGGSAGAIYGFRVQIGDWLLKTTEQEKQVRTGLDKSNKKLVSPNTLISPNAYYLNS